MSSRGMAESGFRTALAKMRLKPCPFCGTAAVHNRRPHKDSYNGTQHKIICGNPFCHLNCDTGWIADMQYATELWNERDG